MNNLHTDQGRQMKLMINSVIAASLWLSATPTKASDLTSMVDEYLSLKQYLTIYQEEYSDQINRLDLQVGRTLACHIQRLPQSMHSDVTEAAAQVYKLTVYTPDAVGPMASDCDELPLRINSTGLDANALQEDLLSMTEQVNLPRKVQVIEAVTGKVARLQLQIDEKLLNE